jgi:hypothetical protein
VTLIEPPPGWTSTPVRPPLAFAARPAAWDGSVVPNLVVAVEPVDAPWPDHAERSVAALVDRLSLPLLVDARAEDGSLLLVVGHELFGRRLTLVQRHLAGAGQATVASFTVADADWPGLCRPVLASVATMRAPS